VVAGAGRDRGLLERREHLLLDRHHGHIVAHPVRRTEHEKRKLPVPAIRPTRDTLVSRLP